EVFYVLFSVGVGALIGWERSRRRRLESLVRHLRSDRDDLRHAGAVGDLPAEGSAAAPVTGTGPELARAIEGDLGGIARDLEKSFVSLLTRLSAMAPCRTCALYVRDGEGEHLRLREALSSQELDLDHRVAAGQGFIGWVFENGAPVLQKRFDSVRQRLPYYRSRQDVGSFLAVPVLSAAGTGGDVVGGVLCADAPVEEALTEEHLKIFELAAGQVSEILSGARTLRRVREEKREFEGLYGFSAVLSGSLRAEELCAALLESAGKIVSFDLGAVVVRNAEAGGASVRVARGLGAEDLEGCPVAAKSSRASWVLETGQTLHLAHRAVSDTGPLLSPKEKLPAFESGVVVPLPSGSQEGVLGCLVLASRKERRLGAFELRLLELLGRQAGSVLLNARLFERMETLATRDGLTGLLNHRSFQERLDAELRRAQRTGAPLCLALTDIDHFKKFNDTYGHPVGDAVLRHLAKLLSTGLRDIDVVARYGGEEFVLVLPETPLRKGLEVCERIRKKIERTALREQGHELSITISMGVAAYPEHAAAKGALIDAADKALYKAKHAGRNRALAWEPAEKYKTALRSLASAGKG
ncbi:MAG: diguanylate cyclase, partial [Bdellovibrionota bacterium]